MIPLCTRVCVPKDPEALEPRVHFQSQAAENLPFVEDVVKLITQMTKLAVQLCAPRLGAQVWGMSYGAVNSKPRLLEEQVFSH